MKKLFEKTELNGIELKNRFFRSATWEGMADEKGFINHKLMQLYENLAKGGVSAIITGYAYVIEEEQPNPGMFGIYSDDLIASYQKLTEMIHENDCKIFLQIVYGGSFTMHNIGNREIWGPSAVMNKITNVTPKEMSKDNIITLIEAFGDAGRRTMLSNFDGVQIHAGHSYLLNQFLSPYFNRREDEYGGSIENRARIIYEIFDNIRKKTNPDYPILIKINCSDFMDSKGFVYEECKEICKKLSDKKITAIEISGGPVFKPPKIKKDRKQIIFASKESYFSEYAKEISKKIETPVILVGGNRSCVVMNNILNSSDIEYFSLARPLLSQPDLINKWSIDSTERPRCVSCGKCFGKEGNICIQDREK